MKTKTITIITILFLSVSASFANPPGGTSGWSKVWKFTDEFNNGFKSNKWAKESLNTGGPWLGGGGVWYFTDRAKNVKVQGGNLRLTHHVENYSHPDGDGPRPHTSGVIASKTRIKYGYFEARYRSAPGSLNSAFWLSGRTPDNKKSHELDIQESRGTGAWHGNTHRVNLHRHKDPVLPEFHWSPTPAPISGQIDNAYYTYGCYWDKDVVEYYLNGSKKFERAHNWLREPLHLRLSLGVFGNKRVDGGQMRVNWVRTWKKN